MKCCCLTSICFRMLLRTKIGTIVWISMVKVWHAAFTIAKMTNHVKPTALDNSKLKLRIVPARLVCNDRFSTLRELWSSHFASYFVATFIAYFRRIAEEDVLVTPMNAMSSQPRKHQPLQLLQQQPLNQQRKQFCFCQQGIQIMCQWS